MKTLFLLLIFGFYSLLVFAQDNKDCCYSCIMTLKDPLRDPETWEKLTQQPTHKKLWETYFNKEEKDWTEEETDKILKWKQILMVRKLSEMQNFRALSKEHETYYTQNGIVISDWNFEKIMESKGDTAVLNKIIAQNPESDLEMYIFMPSPPETDFEAMEKYFAKIFTIFGKTYLTYRNRPAQAANITRKTWIEDHLYRLKILKEKQFRKIVEFLEK